MTGRERAIGSADLPRHEYLPHPSCPPHSDALIVMPLERPRTNPTGATRDNSKHMPALYVCCPSGLIDVDFDDVEDVVVVVVVVVVIVVLLLFFWLLLLLLFWLWLWLWL